MSGRGPRSSDSRGLFARAAHTPMRDFARLRITGRLDIAQMIEEAELPASLGSIVMQVVRRTRLWRIERADVARELIAHFADGLEAGASAEQLVRDFGDTQQAAVLIRRAKKRNRPAWWNTARYGMYGFGFLLLTYAALVAYFVLDRPQVMHDYVADINAVAASATPEERGWPLYREGLLALEPVPEELQDHWPHPPEELWPIAAEYLERNSESLDLFRRAARRPAMGLTIGCEVAPEDQPLWPDMKSDCGSDGLIAVIMPHVAKMREIARLLEVDNKRAAMDGDAEIVYANLVTMLRLPTHLKEHPVLICDLVAFAVLDLALKVIGEQLRDNPQLFTDDALVALAHEISSAAGERTLRMQFEGERMFFADWLQRNFTDDGEGGGKLSPHGLRSLAMLDSGYFDLADTEMPLSTYLAAPVAGFIVGNRRDQMAKYDAFYAMLVEEAAKPLWQRTYADSPDQRVQELEMSMILRLRYLPIVVLMPALSNASIKPHQVAQHRDGILTAIALELYRRRHGKWPTSLDDLTPQYLPQVPIDRFDGKPLRYVVREGRPILYSIGTNHKDDGGVAALDQNDVPQPTAASRWMSAESAVVRGSSVPQGDWILWSRER